MSDIEYPQRVRGSAGYFPEKGKVILEGYHGMLDRALTEFF